MSRAQFGFKKGSIATYLMELKEMLAYYSLDGGFVFLQYLMQMQHLMVLIIASHSGSYYNVTPA